MDMTKIQIGLDFFSAAAFQVDPTAVTPADIGTRIPYETYDDDSNIVYVVISAYLIEADGSSPGLKLDDYFLRPAPIGPRFEILRQSPPERRTVPVPFPPNTALTLTLKDFKGTTIWSDSRRLGLDQLAGDPEDRFVLARDEWKSIALANGQVPPATSWADLVTEQRELALNWLVGAVHDLRTRVLEQKPDSPTTRERQIFSQLVATDPVLSSTSPMINMVGVWRTALGTDDASLGGKLFEAFLQRDPEVGPENPHFSPPRFDLDEEKLSPERLGLPAEIGGKKLLGRSYLKNLWEQKCAILDVSAIPLKQQSDELQSRLQQIKLALGRLFAFGERLRWKDSIFLEPNRAFMRLQPDSSRLPGAVATNIHSLLGLVFRIPLSAVQPALLQTVEFSIDGTAALATQLQTEMRAPGMQSFGDTFAKELTGFVTDLPDQMKVLHKIEVGRDGSHPTGLALFTPRIASSPMVQEPTPLQNGVAQVPPTLLDALTPAGRQNMPRTGQLLAFSPFRRGLKPADLYRAEEVLRPLTAVHFRIKVTLVPLPLAASDLRAYTLTWPGDMDLEEKAFVVANLEKTEAWIPQKDAPIAVIKLGPLVKTFDANCAVLLEVTSGAGSLANALDHRPTTEMSAHGVPIDLVVTKIDVLTKVGDKLPHAFFNLMELSATSQPQPESGPLLAAAQVFDLSFSETVEEFTERVQATYFPSLVNPTTYNKRFRGKFLDFNKLRLFLRAEGAPTRSTVFLTWPEALLPLPVPPTAPVQPEPLPSQVGVSTSDDNPQPSWWVGHSFSKQLAEKLYTSTTRTMRNDESLRYMFQRDPGHRWMLGGLLEHQYSHRIPIAQDASAVHLQLRASNEVMHPAAVTRKAEPAAGEPGGRSIPILRHTLDRSGKVLTLEFPRAHLAAVVGSNTSDELKSDATRDLYEALSDFRIALASPETLLEIELWNFDNLHPILKNDSAEDIRFPSFVTHATRIAQGTLQLASHASALTAGIETLLLPDWDAFTKELDALAASEVPNWFTHPINIDQAWTWIDMNGSSMTSAPDIDSTVNLVRVGLLLRRPQGTTVTAPGNIADLLPSIPSEELAAKVAILSMPDPADATRTIPERFESARAEAWKSIQDWTKPGSGLTERYAWLETVLPKRGDDPAGVREKELAGLLGELRPYLDKPEGLTTNIATVVDLYYAPHAFAPIDRHPDFNDDSVTNGFAVWLLSIVSDLVGGRKPEGIELLAPKTSDEPFLVRKRLTDLLSYVASTLADLVLPVNAPGMPQKSSPGDIALFNAVTKLKDELHDKELTQSDTLKVALTELIERRPELYATARGIGVVIARPETWSRALYSLRIDKRIRDKKIDDLHPDHVASQWSFLDLRGAKDLKPTDPNTKARLYWLDPLEEPYYDAEFSIEQMQFREGQGTDQVTIRVDLDRTLLTEKRVLGRTTVIGKRGGTQARSGEDALEGANSFTGDIQTAAPAGGQVDPVRNLEANTVHWNAAWRVTEAETNQVTDWKYPLPSRSFPIRPIPVRARGSLTAPLTLAIISTDPQQKYREGFEKSLREVLTDPDRKTVVIEDGNGGTTTWSQLAGSQALAQDHIQGWHQIDTFIAFHHLLVELETDNNQSEDIVEVEVETSADGFSDESVDGGEAQFKSVLARHYHYHTAASGTGVVQPAAISQTEFAARAERWLLDPTSTTESPYKDENEGSEALLRQAQTPVEMPPKGRTATYHYRRGKHTVDQWELDYISEINTSPHTDGVGNVMACELFEASTVKGALLRIAVLVEPWSICRVRARIIRNVVDFQGGETDAINEAFMLRSPRSDWSSHGRDCLVLTSDTMQQRGLPEDESVLDVLPQITLHDWQYGPTTTAAIMLGAMAKHTLSAKVNTTYGLLPWWSSLALSNAYSVSGIVQTPGSDHFIRIGVAVWDDMKPLAYSVPRRFIVPTSADALEVALGTIKYSDIGSSALELRLVWTLQQGDQILDITWPIAFQES